MAIEKFWEQVSAVPFIADGGENGVVTVNSVANFKVKQLVKIEAIGLPPLRLQVKRVISYTQLIVGALKTKSPGSSINNLKIRTDISAYTVANSATISATEQDKVLIPPRDINQAVYEHEPTNAIRSFLVDYLGNRYSTKNPVPVQLSDGSLNIGTVNAELEVQLSHKDNTPDVGDVADSVQIGDGEDKLEINNDGSINVITGAPVSPQIINIPVPNANTEYDFIIPQNTGRYRFRARGNAKVKYSFESGKTDTEYFTVIPGNIESEDNLKLNGNLTVYFRANKSNEILELLLWEK